jgi:hypothetical protein
MFKNLVSPFDTIIRNAIAHRPQTIIDSVLRSIRFLDSKDSRKYIDVRFSDFITKTRELGADVYVLSMIGVAFNLRYTEKMKKYFRNLTNPEPPQEHSSSAANHSLTK